MCMLKNEPSSAIPKSALLGSFPLSNDRLLRFLRLLIFVAALALAIL